MRRRRLRKLLERLEQLQKQKNIDRDKLIFKLGWAKKEAGRAYGLLDIHLPDKITRVCFANLSEEITANREEWEQIEIYEFKQVNVFLVPPGDAEGMQYKQIDHLDVAKITENENPYCVDAGDKLVIKKDFYDKLVWVE